MDKSPDAFRTISEVAELLETPAHVLRFWESRFPQIKPVKRAGGRRYYRPADMALLAGIRKLLHDEGMTIRGVQKVLREQGVRYVSGLTEDYAYDDPDTGEIVLPVVPVKSAAPIPLFPQRVDSPTEPDAPATQQPAETAESQPDLPLQGKAAETTNAVPASPPEPEPSQDGPAEAPQPEPTADDTPAPQPETRPEPKQPAEKPPAIAAAPSKAPQKTPLPSPLPSSADISVDGLAADLRRLHPGAFGANTSQAQALLVRLQALRNRASALGRSARR